MKFFVIIMEFTKIFHYGNLELYSLLWSFINKKLYKQNLELYKQEMTQPLQSLYSHELIVLPDALRYLRLGDSHSLRSIIIHNTF